MEGRDGAGRFAKGNPGGPGRPKRPTEAMYLRALTEAVSLEAWEEMVRAVAEQARAGDMRAIGWLGRYLLGTPSGVAPNLGELARSEADGTTQEEAGGVFDFEAAGAILEGLRRMPPPVPAQRPSVAEELDAAVRRHSDE